MYGLDNSVYQYFFDNAMWSLILFLIILMIYGVMFLVNKCNRDKSECLMNYYKFYKIAVILYCF